MDKNQVLNLGKIELHTATRRLFINKSCIFLRNKEFTLLEYFIKNIGIVLSRTKILEDVWDCNICCVTNTVDVHISSLRKTFLRYLGNCPIKTVYCVGYIFEV